MSHRHVGRVKAKEEVEKNCPFVFFVFKLVDPQVKRSTEPCRSSVLHRGRHLHQSGDQPVEEWVGAVGGHGPGVLGHGGGHGVGAAILIHTGGQLVPQGQLLVVIGGGKNT